MTQPISDKTIAQPLAMRLNAVKPSPTLAVAQKANELIAEGKAVINLSVGEPDFDTPEHIKLAAIRAISEGHTKYTAVDGITPLKKAILQKFKRDNHLNYELNQILVSVGAKHSLYNSFAALLDPEDEVIIPAPYWVSYPDMVKLFEAKPVIIPTTHESHFKLTKEKLAKTITSKTKLLILNSPSNPTGVAYSRNELKAIAEALLDHPQVFIVTDDIYESNMWNQLPFTNIVSACNQLYDRTIVVNGVSKSYSMTGWRIGYAAGPKNIIQAMKKIQSQSTSNPCSIAQYAALEALTGDQTCIREMTKAYKERHDFIQESLNRLPGVISLPADGTFYAFPYVEEAYTKLGLKDDIAFSEFLLTQAEIAVVPGSAFGAPGYIRLSYATGFENLKEAMKRLQALIK